MPPDLTGHKLKLVKSLHLPEQQRSYDGTLPEPGGSALYLNDSTAGSAIHYQKKRGLPIELTEGSRVSTYYMPILTARHAQMRCISSGSATSMIFIQRMNISVAQGPMFAFLRGRSYSAFTSLSSPITNLT